MLSVNELEDALIDLSFAEDIGDGDHTTLCCIPEDAMGKSRLLIKEDGILAGVEVAKRVFARFDPDMQVEVLIGDGSPVKKGDVADAEHHATDERYCHYDQPLCKTARRNTYKGAGYP